MSNVLSLSAKILSSEIRIARLEAVARQTAKLRRASPMHPLDRARALKGHHCVAVVHRTQIIVVNHYLRRKSQSMTHAQASRVICPALDRHPVQETYLYPLIRIDFRFPKSIRDFDRFKSKLEKSQVDLPRARRSFMSTFSEPLTKTIHKSNGPDFAYLAENVKLCR